MDEYREKRGKKNKPCATQEKTSNHLAAVATTSQQQQPSTVEAMAEEAKLYIYL